MNRNLIGTLSLAVLSLVLTTGAHAQSIYGAYVPFAFQASTVQMPAGQYQIKQDHYRKTIQIRNVTTGSIMVAQMQQDAHSGASLKMVFHHLGNQYFLARISGTPDTTDVVLSPSRQEKEFRRLQVAQTGPSKNSEQVLLALK